MVPWNICFDVQNAILLLCQWCGGTVKTNRAITCTEQSCG